MNAYTFMPIIGIYAYMGMYYTVVIKLNYPLVELWESLKQGGGELRGYLRYKINAHIGINAYYRPKCIGIHAHISIHAHICILCLI